MSKRLTGLLVDPNNQNGDISKIIINDYNEDISKVAQALDCEYVEIVTRNFGGNRYAIICDEDGKLKQNQFVSIITRDFYGHIIEYFVGKCLILKINTKSEIKNLHNSDFEKLLKHQANILAKDKKYHKVLQCTL